MARSLDNRGTLRAADARALLIPPYAPGVPAEVAEANDRAVAAVEAFERADEGWAEANRTELRAEAIDLEAGEIHVTAGWDRIEGRQPTKGRERRTVPIIGELRTILAADLLRTGRRGADLAFGATAASPFCPITLTRHADRVWKAAGLKRITPHECRHSFASIAIAAGVNIGTVSAALGHASVTITWERYHHLMPGTMDQAADLIQAYVAGG